MSAKGSDSGTFAVESFFILIAGLVVLASLVGVAFVFDKSSRTHSILLIAMGIAFVTSLSISSYISRIIWQQALVALADRSTSIVEAIRRYETTHGEPPPSLDSLAPEYLPEPPTTGLGTWPHYNYAARGGTWDLSVNLSVGIPVLHRFFHYDPTHTIEQAYADHHPKRVGDWVEIAE